MPIARYGVLACRAVERRREGSAETPHYQIHLLDNSGTHYRAAVNVLSQQAPSELLYAADDDFRHPLTAALPPAGSGWTPLPSERGGAALDFIRGNMFVPASMRTLPPDLPGVDNDLADLLDHYVERAVADPTTALYLFGQRFGPEPGKPDATFGFRPGNGVHDIHMNQGNVGRFRNDDGVWQDGALLFHLPVESRWTAIFLAFQSQAWHTDDVTGHALPTPALRPSVRDAPLRVVGVRTDGFPATAPAESVTLLNASPEPLELTGWQLADAHGNLLALPAQILAPGDTATVSDGDGFHLDKSGGAVTLLDPGGLKVHGVAYTGQQRRREGWMITF
ncbi:hypothetical protein BLA24_07995 [Streptomyces cinnamoneus]|uniref:LTD domain-containing protein n=1 Tax=Streptomyces cinnamoneus TaxID=53446 RepID=A0A2G1XME3_STRCJ|nr:DUF2278 family protein [Streptomyces cinnamoneus]PHQ52380.1 hypothetical protein BLA24_07995 [Streptomyces cinnamoneus]PPT11582.1 DUF2278 domain-containing protein [Streptomyces cinnamoneus]